MRTFINTRYDCDFASRKLISMVKKMIINVSTKKKIYDMSERRHKHTAK